MKNMKEKLGQLAEELKKLSMIERQVIVLYYYENMSFNEISRKLTLKEKDIKEIHDKASYKLITALEC